MKMHHDDHDKDDDVCWARCKTSRHETAWKSDLMHYFGFEPTCCRQKVKLITNL